MSKNKQITVLKETVNVQSIRDADYISVTDIARFQEPERTDHVIQNWMRNRNTIEFLGIWERLNNPDFKPLEFEGFRRKAGLNSFVLTPKQWIEQTGSEADVLNMALFGKTAKEWRDSHPSEKGNIRDHANVSQLVCLSNLENLNALPVRDHRHAEIERRQPGYHGRHLQFSERVGYGWPAGASRGIRGEVNMFAEAQRQLAQSLCLPFRGSGCRLFSEQWTQIAHPDFWTK